MDRFKHLNEFGRFELRWKIIFTFFAIIFAGALLDHMLRAPIGRQAVWCYSAGALGFLGALWSAHVLRDGARMEGARGGLGLLGEDLSAGNLDD
ncbi:hypothetical protein ABT364_03360 [Massilia sp. SR12]